MLRYTALRKHIYISIITKVSGFDSKVNNWNSSQEEITKVLVLAQIAKAVGRI